MQTIYYDNSAISLTDKFYADLNNSQLINWDDIKPDTNFRIKYLGGYYKLNWYETKYITSSLLHFLQDKYFFHIFQHRDGGLLLHGKTLKYNINEWFWYGFKASDQNEWLDPKWRKKIEMKVFL